MTAHQEEQDSKSSVSPQGAGVAPANPNMQAQLQKLRPLFSHKMVVPDDYKPLQTAGELLSVVRAIFDDLAYLAEHSTKETNADFKSLVQGKKTELDELVLGDSEALLLQPNAVKKHEYDASSNALEQIDEAYKKPKFDVDADHETLAVKDNPGKEAILARVVHNLYRIQPATWIPEISDPDTARIIGICAALFEQMTPENLSFLDDLTPRTFYRYCVPIQQGFYYGDEIQLGEVVCRQGNNRVPVALKEHASVIGNILKAVMHAESGLWATSYDKAIASSGSLSVKLAEIFAGDQGVSALAQNALAVWWQDHVEDLLTLAQELDGILKSDEADEDNRLAVLKENQARLVGIPMTCYMTREQYASFVPIMGEFYVEDGSINPYLEDAGQIRVNLKGFLENAYCDAIGLLEFTTLEALDEAIEEQQTQYDGIMRKLGELHVDSQNSDTTDNDRASVDAAKLKKQKDFLDTVLAKIEERTSGNDRVVFQRVTYGKTADIKNQEDGITRSYHNYHYFMKDEELVYPQDSVGFARASYLTTTYAADFLDAMNLGAHGGEKEKAFSNSCHFPQNSWDSSAAVIDRLKTKIIARRDGLQEQLQPILDQEQAYNDSFEINSRLEKLRAKRPALVASAAEEERQRRLNEVQAGQGGLDNQPEGEADLPTPKRPWYKPTPFFLQAFTAIASIATLIAGAITSILGMLAVGLPMMVIAGVVLIMVVMINRFSGASGSVKHGAPGDHPPAYSAAALEQAGQNQDLVLDAANNPVAPASPPPYSDSPLSGQGAKPGSADESEANATPPTQ